MVLLNTLATYHQGYNPANHDSPYAGNLYIIPSSSEEHDLRRTFF